MQTTARASRHLHCDDTFDDDLEYAGVETRSKTIRKRYASVGSYGSILAREGFAHSLCQ